MAFALPLFAHFFGMFQDISARRACAPSTLRPPARAVGLQGVELDSASLLHRGPAVARHWAGPTRTAACQRPLRVLRVVEGRCGTAEAGRMVISGRMADVCAELDRLAESETRH